MKLDEFRIKHSLLIEQYQYIELHLEGIYATTCKSGFFNGLEEVEKSNMTKILSEIKKIQQENKTEVLSQELCERIERAILRRNFWCHNCYTDMTFELNGDPKKEEDIKSLIEDLTEAEELRKLLFGLKQLLLVKIKPQGLFSNKG